MIQSAGGIKDPRCPRDRHRRVLPQQRHRLASFQDSVQSDRGSGVGVAVAPRQRFRGTDQQNVDFPSAYATFSKNGPILGTYLLTVP
jgi:hypothetical protein